MDSNFILVQIFLSCYFSFRHPDSLTESYDAAFLFLRFDYVLTGMIHTWRKPAIASQDAHLEYLQEQVESLCDVC